MKIDFDKEELELLDEILYWQVSHVRSLMSNEGVAKTEAIINTLAYRLQKLDALHAHIRLERIS